ncbi:hypothetical protein L6164_017794 [Bauhinia variegata]|uniref:Uncharacterized protein n=1 Tax=Bauhinia variegata TaxID=167791 RepID=A0ACB9N9T5_BAUVA|nr:hypothetical protein L6164_017794 [Bauhinia variegata]
MENSLCPSVANLSSSLVLEEHGQEFKEWLASLPKAKSFSPSGITLYQDFWCPTRLLQNVISFQNHFHAHDHDIILASKPKSGTTWLKAIIFSIVNRTQFTLTNTPLLTKVSHELVPFFEAEVYRNNAIPDLTTMSSPRLFSTHVPYASLPKSIKESKCRIIYLCRNPFDTLVSLWQFGSHLCDIRSSGWTFEEFVERFCEGKEVFGPFWSHVLGYWKESIENPNKVLFLKYEDLKEDIIHQMKRLAEFIGFPFSPDELKQGVVEDISKLCSLNVLKDLEVNKNGKHSFSDVNKNGKHNFVPNKSFYRKGEVGDWVNHFSPSMLERLNKMIEGKFKDSSLNFKYLAS